MREISPSLHRLLPRVLPFMALASVCLVAATAQAQSTPAARNTRHALVIGIGEYLDPNVPALKGIPHDMLSAQRMAPALLAAE